MKEGSQIVERFIGGMQNIMMGMQKVDNSCMEIFGQVSKRDFGLLIMLGSTESMMMREVAEYLQVPMSTATGIVDKLIENGFVKRFDSPQDRRIVMVQLSSLGNDLYTLLQAKLYQYGKQILESFEDHEKEEFVNFMERASQRTTSLEKVD